MNTNLSISMVLKTALMLAIVVLAAIGSIYVLGVVEEAVIMEALGKVFALLGIFTGSALALTMLANLGVGEQVAEPFKG